MHLKHMVSDGRKELKDSWNKACTENKCKSKTAIKTENYIIKPSKLYWQSAFLRRLIRAISSNYGKLSILHPINKLHATKLYRPGGTKPRGLKK